MIKIFTKNFFLFFLIWLSSLESKAQSVGGTTSGAATYCSSANTGFISLTGHTGSILNWESSTDGGATWTNIANVTSAQSYFGLTLSTCYRAIVQLVGFPPDTSSISCITVFLPSVGGSITGGGTFCSSAGPGSLVLTGNNGSVLYWQFSTDGGATWTTVSDTNTTIPFPGTSVNTLYWAIVQNGPTCPTDTSSQASFIILPPSVGGSVTADDSVCFLFNLGTLNLSGNTGSVVGWISSTDGGITWSPIVNTTSSLTYSGLIQNTMYAAIVQNGTCTPDTSSAATITVFPLSPVSAGNDTTISLGESVVLNGSGSGFPLWSSGSTLSSSVVYNPTAMPAQTTNYVLTVTDINGCINSDDVIITVIQPEFNGIISNLFTPNGDGVNDYWYIQEIQNYPENEVFVFNIYGQQIYNQKNYMNDWAGTYNGKEVPDGTYYYVLKFTDPETVLKGSIDILRNR